MRTIFTTNLSTSIATISQRMIAEDYRVFLLFRNSQTLLGVITRQDHGSGLTGAGFYLQPLIDVGQKDSNRERPLPIHE